MSGNRRVTLTTRFWCWCWCCLAHLFRSTTTASRITIKPGASTHTPASPLHAGIQIVAVDASRGYPHSKFVEWKILHSDNLAGWLAGDGLASWLAGSLAGWLIAYVGCRHCFNNNTNNDHNSISRSNNKNHNAQNGEFIFGINFHSIVW